MAVQLQQPIEQEQQFQPQLTEQQTRSYVNAYRNDRTRYEPQLESIRAHAQYYNVPFYEGDFSIIEAVKQAGAGFVEGFTTLKIADHPDNEYEAIFRIIGHLAGFAPGIIAGPAKALRLTGLAKAASALGDKSIPMLGAKYATKYAKNLTKTVLKSSAGSRFGAMDTASKFLLGNKAKHIMEGAFHLGSASAISSVWEGVDGMVESFFGGAIAGGVFRGIGNMINIKGDPTSEKFVRGLAGSLFMGLPATQRGATTPEQIYEYLMGAYFGGKEMPWFKAKAGKNIKKIQELSKDSPKMEVEKNPELIPGFSEQPEVVRKETIKQAEGIWGNSDTRTGMHHQLMYELGILEQIPEKEFAEKGPEAGYPELMKVLKSGVTPSGKKLIGMMGVSGGAEGADTYFGYILDKAGIPVVHYITPDLAKDFTKRHIGGARKAGLPNYTKILQSIPREMSERELLNNIPEVDRAALNLGKNVPVKAADLIARNSEIIKKSSKVYAVGQILDADFTSKNPKEREWAASNPQLYGRAMPGGTGWGVQMAINARKPIYVFDQRPSKNSWYKFDYRAKGGGRFVPLKGVPELSQRPGLIGTRKLSKQGRQAIREVVAKAFPESFPKVKITKDARLPGAKSEKDFKETHPETLKQLFKLTDKEVELSVKAKDIKDVIKEGKVDKVRLKELKKELKEVNKELRKVKKDVNIRLKLRPTEKINEETQRVESDVIGAIDTGMPFTQVGMNSLNFAKTYLKDFWDTKGTLLSTKNDMLTLRAQQINDLMTQYIEPGSKNNRAPELVKAIEETFSISLPTEAKGRLRQWIRINNQGKNVRYLRMIGNKLSLTNRGNPMSYSGKRKETKQPESILAGVYKNDFKGKEKKKSTEEPVVIFDEVTVEHNNTLKDVPIYRLLKHLENIKKPNGFNRYTKKKAKEIYDKKLAYVIKTMYNKHDMVPYGGSGDKARIVFVKLHPEARKSEAQVQKQLRTIMRALKKVDKDSKNLYKFSKMDYKKRFGKDLETQFDRAFYSNVLYDLRLNGFTVDKNFNKNINTLFGKGFVPSAVGYNKRAQIWLNSFFKGDKNFFKGKGLGMTKSGNFSYILTSDPETPYIHNKTKKQISAEDYGKLSAFRKKSYSRKSSVKATNIELPEHVDGAIMVRTDVIKKLLEDAGLPYEDAAQSKSFIISRNHNDNKGNPLGTLLGKYMMHDAGPTQSADMKKAGIHFNIMTSAAKQTGTRKMNTPYELNPEDVYYSPSTFGQEHMKNPQIWVKQLFTNLHQYGHKHIPKEVIEDINQSVIQEKVKGTEEGNKILQKYMDTLDDSKLNHIFKNLDKIGTNEIIKAAKTPGAERFANKLFDKMLDANIEMIKEQVREGEMTAEQADLIVDDMVDFKSSTDRLLQAASLISENSPKGKTGFPAYFHRYIRDYRNQVMHNWVSRQVTRPKMDNSGVAFIRPYDKYLQKDARWKELNKRDDIFYLDKAYETMKIHLAHKIHNKNEITLGELWKLFNTKDYFSPSMQRYVQDVFDAVVLRVPMDSMSGAHKLRFKGFTDREGHGVLMHSRAMRALGGADLDGDEAFFYFGGRLESGEGQGMKKSWKEAIHAQKEEFYTGKKGERDVKDNKKALIERPDGKYSGKTYADLLAEQGENALKESKTLFYSPMARLQASEGAVQGRDMLGTAANSSQVIRSAYSLIADSKSKQDVFEFSKYNSKTKQDEEFKVTVTPKDKSWAQYQREMIRAQIAFGSDPLDEAGLKDASTFFKLLHEAHFDVNVQKRVKTKGRKKGAWKAHTDELSAFDLKRGLYGKLADMNKANFGRDYTNDRNWTFEERMKMNRSLEEIDADNINTMLPKMGETLSRIDYSDHIYNRLDPVEVKKMYKQMEEYVKDLEWLKEPMQRSSFRVKYNDEIKALFRNHGTEENPRYLFEETTLQNLINYKQKVGKDIFLEAIEGTTWAKRLNRKENQWMLFSGPRGAEQREAIVREIIRNGEDFLINDFVNMTSIMNVVDVVKKNNISPKKISEIHEKSEFFKNNSYMNAKARGNLKFLEVPDTEVSEKLRADGEILDRMLQFAAGKKLKLPDKKRLLGDKVTSFMDQVELDAQISKYKETLNKGEKELLDHMLLGNLNRGDYEKIQKIYNMMPENMKDPLTEDLYRKVMREAAKTNLSRVGFNSTSVKQSAVYNHLNKLSKLFNKTWDKPTEVAEEVIKEVNKETITLADGKEEQGYLGTSYQTDPLVEKGLNNEGFAGIKKADITKKDKAIITELAGYLKEQNEMVGRDLNGILRGITGELYERGKDLNTFNRQDFININNFFKEIKSGNMFQRIWGDTSPEMKSRYYHMFPEAVTRELMKYDIDWIKQQGHFVTKDGSVKEGEFKKPTYFMDVLMNQINETGGLAVAKSERLVTENAQRFFFLEELPRKNDFFSFAVLDREMKMLQHLDAQKDMPDGTKELYKRAYRQMHKDIYKKIDWDKTKDKKYTVSNDEGKRIEVTGWEIVNGSNEKGLTGIKRRLNTSFKELYKYISGDRKWMRAQKYIQAGTYGKGQYKVNIDKFISDVHQMFRAGDKKGLENLFEKVGIDGMRHISRGLAVKLTKGENKKNFKNFLIRDTGKIAFDRYWPHMFFSRKAATNAMKNAIEHINNDPFLTEQEKKDEIQKITYRHKALTGDWDFADMHLWDTVNKMSIEESLDAISALKKEKRVKKEKGQSIYGLNADYKLGSMNKRTGHIPGWSTDITVMDAYIRNISNTFYKHLQQVLAQDTINTAYNKMTKKFGPELAHRWKKFFQLYAQGAMGNPDIIPEKIFNDKNMKISGTPYGWWADNRVLDRVNSISDKLGIKKKDIPRELQKFGYQDIRNWSNMEAKFELMSLLAHPKSAITNIFGGSIHTIESASLGAFKKGRDIKFLKRINPKWNSMKDVEKWVIEKGVLPEFLVHELGLGDHFKGKKITEFVGEMSEMFQSKDKMNRKDMRELAHKYGVTERAVQFASKFMSIPERTLRRDAFMAHYIRAWERFGGAVKDPNHPFLIEMAKKGVKATQFLYNAPNRPMFARSALGKVMSRFQLFAWNSIRFRNNILKEAKRLGFAPGEATDRFARTMQIDLLVLALSNMFMYSLFDTALPPPWNWMQDTADWLLGDEKERDKAFFGELPWAIAPLKMVTPPITRGLTTGISQWIRDDYSKFSDYTIWTMFPFGRMVRDVAKPGSGLMHNPTFFMEKVAGMPLHDIGRKIKQREKDEEKGTRKTGPKPGVKFGY